jgi:hypothetical protein
MAGISNYGWEAGVKALDCEMARRAVSTLTTPRPRRYYLGNVNFENQWKGEPMKFSEIANRLTGISTPFGGAS